MQAFPVSRSPVLEGQFRSGLQRKRSVHLMMSAATPACSLHLACGCLSWQCLMVGLSISQRVGAQEDRALAP